MQTMFTLTEHETRVLTALGERLRSRRIDKRDTQIAFAARIGVSVPTYRKLEKGDPSVPIGAWVRAIRLLGDISGVDALLPVSLLSDSVDRQRVSKRRRL